MPQFKIKLGNNSKYIVQLYMYLFPLTSFAGSSLLKDRMETSVSMGDNFQTRRTSCKNKFVLSKTLERTRNKLIIIT